MRIYFCILLFLLSFTLNAVAQDLPNKISEEKLEDTSVKFPFHFSFIMGITGETAFVGNHLAGESYSLLKSPYEILFSKIILIGKLNVDTTYSYISQKSVARKYYEAYCNGKQFYIDAKDVELDTDNMSYLDSLSRAPQEIQDRFNIETKKLALSLHIKQLDRILDYYKKHKPYGLSVINSGVYDESEYTDGTGFSIDLMNPTKKTIKYITLNIVGYNAVDDKVLSKGKYVQSVKCVGPINPDESTSYSFKYVWFTDMVEYSKITSITVQYMDGTTKYINNVKLIQWTKDDSDYNLKSYPDLMDIRGEE